MSGSCTPDRLEKATSYKPSAHASGESDEPVVRFTALLHHVTIDLPRDSYYLLKRQAAPGVNGVTWEQYGEGLEERVKDLHDRVHRGAYRAQPSKRTYIPKADGRQRPLGIAALEDKIVQQAVVTVLNQIYAGDFLGFSYGFRPGRSQRGALWAALDALAVGLRLSRFFSNSGPKISPLPPVGVSKWRTVVFAARFWLG